MKSTNSLHDGKYMNNTIQRRLKRESYLKKFIVALLITAIAFLYFSCSNDDEQTCNCKGKFINDEGVKSYVDTELECESQYPYRPIIKEGYFVECVEIDY